MSTSGNRNRLWIGTLLVALGGGGMLYAWSAERADSASAYEGVIEADREGLDLKSSPPQVEAHFLSSVLRGKSRTKWGHVFYGRHLFVLDLRGKESFDRGHLPTAISTTMDEIHHADQHPNLGILDMQATIVVCASEGQDIEEFLSVRREEVFLLSKGWESASPDLDVTPPAEPMVYEAPDPPHAHDTQGPGLNLPLMTAQELKSKLDGDSKPMVLFIGDKKVFAQKHIPGAVVVEGDEFDQYFADRDRDQEIVVYCACCHAETNGVSGMFAERLTQLGYKNVWVLRGHWTAWVAAGYPTEP